MRTVHFVCDRATRYSLLASRYLLKTYFTATFVMYEPPSAASTSTR